MSKAVYFNKKQIEVLKAPQKDRTMIWGRGTGKSTVIAGITRMKASALPRAKIFFSSTTYNQILTKTLPPIEQKWQEFGLIEDIHYVVGKKPPKNFVKALSAPRRYQNVITFFNGFTIEFISLDRPDLARGGSYDGGEIDEAALIQKEHYTKVLLPSIRGNRHRFSSHWHGNVNKFSSIPWKPSGYWIMEDEEKAKADPENYFYSEARYTDNIEVLGSEWAERMRREMGYLEYLIEVENQRIHRVPDCFYPALDESKHCYAPGYNYGEGERGITVQGTKDIDSKQLLQVSFDFSGWFNCCTIFQSDPLSLTERMIDAIHVDGDLKVNDLVDKICRKYQGHKFKFVQIYGEPRGHDRRATGSPIYEDVKARFAFNGWDVELVVKPGRTHNHEERFLFMDDILKEEYRIYPKLRINEENCKDPVIAMQVTEVTPEFKKNKKKERDRNFPQHHAPHYTDTIDYFFMQKHGWRRKVDPTYQPNSVTFS